MSLSNYSIKEKIYNGFCLLITKIYYKNSRLIRRPIIIRGKKYIDFGKKLTTGRNCILEVTGKHSGKVLTFGNNVNIGNNVRIECSKQIEIGNNVLIASNVLLIDSSHGSYSGVYQDSPSSTPNARELSSMPIKIGNNVWIGENSVIQKGIIIGDGAIIGANSVVTKNIDSNTIVGGIPAVILKRWDGGDKKWKKIR